MFLQDALDERHRFAALAGVGVTLPSLALDVPMVTAWHAEPLIDLGRCSLPTARKVAAVLRDAAR
ncbi:hypothetical protein [Streptomyces pseudogriseolus]|uniref:hypothetical protein n=1 Tax=Streptomyces pseudogriseolus TaxID=36817 RepID=UPI00364AD69A